MGTPTWSASSSSCTGLSAGDNARVRVETSHDGRARLHVDHLEALVEPESLAWLRKTAQAMLPRVDLPELLLEVHAWTTVCRAS